MALPDYPFYEAGTPITWTSSGGSKAITATSLATSGNAAREGDKSASLVDGTKGMPAFLEIAILSKASSAVTDGGTLDLFIGESDSGAAGTNNPGNLTGADAALSNPNELKRQLKYAGALVFSNARGTNAQMQRLPRYYVTCPYIIPVLQNNTSQNLSSTGTDHVVTVTPYYRKIAD